jgi:hypothetical protein
MNKGDAARIISRRLNLNLGRSNALLVAASDAGVLPKARGRDVPQLSSLQLAHVLLALVCDKGIGVAGQSVCEFAALRAVSGATLIDLLEGWTSGAVSTSGLHSLIVQVFPEPSATVVLHDSRLQFGPERTVDGASRTIVIPGDALRAIVDELRGVAAALHPAPPRATTASFMSVTAHVKAA